MYKQVLVLVQYHMADYNNRLYTYVYAIVIKQNQQKILSNAIQIIMLQQVEIYTTLITNLLWYCTYAILNK